MCIIWHGHSCFSIKTKSLLNENINIVIDPFDGKKTGINLPKLKADIVLSSHNHYDHNNVKAIQGNPFIVKTLGEFEIKNVFIQGIPSFHDKKNGAERGNNIIFYLESEKIHIAHLGDLGHILDEKQMSKLSKIDILMVPVGGKYTINYSEAIEVINQIEPKIIIPMHYKIPGLKVDIDTVDKFAKEMGVDPNKKTDKLKIAQKNLPTDRSEIIIMDKK
ncbi:MAG: MBL fold metallo-hydrolase [Patescibacteria group bacterium]|nr:MBL fold metallo-hydrolase [Patescibacteria group bacterium]